MSDHHEDDALRAEFQRLRAETEGAVPEFQRMLPGVRGDSIAGPAGDRAATGSRGRWSSSVLRIGGWSSLTVAAAVSALLLWGGSPESDADAAFEALVTSYAADAAGGAWRSPTSGLLDVIGMDLTRSVPSIGGGGAAPPSGDPGGSEPAGRQS